MKKNLTFIFFLLGFIALVGSLPIKADEVNVVTPYPYDSGLTLEEINESNNIGVFINYLMNGGTIDYSNSSDNYSADDLLNDFEDFFDNVTEGFVDVTKKALGIKDEFKILYPLNSPWAKHGADILISLLPSVDNENNTPTPQPDIDYLYYLDAINGSGFWFQNFPNKNGFNEIGLSTYPPDLLSWYCVSQDFGTTYIYNKNYYCYAFDILDINIFSGENGQYYFDISTSNPLPVWNVSQNTFWDYGVISYWMNIGHGTFDGVSNGNMGIHEQYHGTLTEVFNYIINRFKNVNIYVDGVLWSSVNTPTQYNINITNGTVEPITNSPVHWQYEDEIYTDIEDIKDRLQDLIDRPVPKPITFPDFEDLIVDVNGQRAFAVTVIQEDTNIDEQYFDNYGPLIPIFVPLFTPVIDDADIVNIISAPMDALPSDLLDIFGYLFIGTLFVCFIHRLLE